MSEPMSNVEIEDVLSSIRRLVSDDLRPQPRAARGDAPAVAAADKLVLTPALRIVPEPQAEPVPEPEPVPESMAEPLFHTVRGALGGEAGFIAIEDEDRPEAEHARGVVSAFAPESYEDEDAPAPVEVLRPVHEPAMTELPPDAVVWAEPAAEAPVQEAWVAPATDTPEDGAAAPATEDWADAAEAAVRAELEAEAGQAAYARYVDEPEEAAFDEGALRELVRDIIREELQGTLGERITRNVRKLVRAEIARALAVRDFE